MSNLVRVTNTTAQLVAPKATVKRVQWLVAWREQDLPPPDAQTAIKEFIRKGRRYGAEYDLQRIRGDAPTMERMVAAGFDHTRLTKRMLNQVLRQRGVWDGWRPMVSASGTFPAGLCRHTLLITKDLLDFQVPFFLPNYLFTAKY